MLVHNEIICFENMMGVLGDKIDITDCDRASSGMPRIRPNRAESDDINIRSYKSVHQAHRKPETRALISSHHGQLPYRSQAV
jgi:hypothetical protein